MSGYLRISLWGELPDGVVVGHIWIPSAWTVPRLRSTACALSALVRPAGQCWCPDNELADAHHGECKYRRMAEVMGELDAARDELLEEDGELKERVKDVKEVEKRIHHKLLPGNAWKLIPFFELFMCSTRTNCINGEDHILVCTGMY